MSFRRSKTLRTCRSFCSIERYNRYKDQFGFTLPNRPIIVDDIRIRALAKSAMTIDRTIEKRPENTPLQATKVLRSSFELSFHSDSM